MERKISGVIAAAGLALALGFAGSSLHARAQGALDTSAANANVDVVRRFWDAFNRQAWSELDGLTTKDYVHHSNGGSATLGTFKLGGMRVHRGMSNYVLTIDDVVASGDRVAVRWTARGMHTGSMFGETPTGKPLTVYGMHVHRLYDGKIAEDWEVIDTGNLREQIGAN
jgi:steroid delta-isomerase-like uncharacterized protein